jgi:hypothetical protein
MAQHISIMNKTVEDVFKESNTFNKRVIEIGEILQKKYNKLVTLEGSFFFEERSDSSKVLTPECRQFVTHRQIKDETHTFEVHINGVTNKLIDVLWVV